MCCGADDYQCQALARVLHKTIEVVSFQHPFNLADARSGHCKLAQNTFVIQFNKLGRFDIQTFDSTTSVPFQLLIRHPVFPWFSFHACKTVVVQHRYMYRVVVKGKVFSFFSHSISKYCMFITRCACGFERAALLISSYSYPAMMPLSPPAISPSLAAISK